MSQTASTKHHATGHQPSRKVMQITGQDVDVMDSITYQPDRATLPPSMGTLSESAWAAFAGSAALRMGFLDQKEDVGPVPPLIEGDGDGNASSKSHDSWEPVSPGAAQPAPWMTDAAVADAQHDSDFRGHVRSASSESDSKVRDLFNLHSNDFEVAWNYHTIATELAAHKRPATSHGVEKTTPRQAAPPKTVRFTKILHSDTSRRHRSTLPAIVTSVEQRPTSRHRDKPLPRIPHQGVTVKTPVTPPSAPQSAVPKSAFDESDSEDDEGGDHNRWGASPGLVKDWLARRSGDGGSLGHTPAAVRSSLLRRSGDLSKPRLASKSSMRGLLTGAKDKARSGGHSNTTNGHTSLKPRPAR